MSNKLLSKLLIVAAMALVAVICVPRSGMLKLMAMAVGGLSAMFVYYADKKVYEQQQKLLAKKSIKLTPSTLEVGMGMSIPQLFPNVDNDGNELWKVVGKKIIVRSINEKNFPMTDLALSADGKDIIVRTIDDKSLILSQILFEPYGDAVRNIIDVTAADDGILVNQDGDQYHRQGGNCPVHCVVKTAQGTEHMTIWHYASELELYGHKVVQHLYVQLSGHYNQNNGQIVDGDCSLTMLHGEELVNFSCWQS